MRQTRNGFTLVEVIIAALVIAGGLLIVAAVMGNSARQARQGGITTQAPLIAQNTIEELKATQTTGGSLACGNTVTTTEVDGVTYTINQTLTPQRLDNTSGELQAVNCPAADPDAYEAILVLTWQVDGITQTAEYTELISTGNLAEPSIAEFTATSVNFNSLGYIENPGDPTRNIVTLNWDVPTGAQPLSISITSDPPGIVNETNLPPHGTLEIHATQTAMYTLTATNPVGEDTLSIPVSTNNSITSFQARSSDPDHPSDTGPLDDITLTWELQAVLHPELEFLVLSRNFNAHSITGPTTITEIANPGTLVEQAEMPSPALSQQLEWTLEHYLRIGEDLSDSVRVATATATMQLHVTPVITDFSVDPAAMCLPSSAVPVLLTYDVIGGVAEGTQLQITAPGYINNLNRTTGTAQPSISTATTFTLTATNNAGQTSTANTSVHMHPPAIINSFHASPSNPIDGTPFFVTWDTTNAATTVLNGTSVAASGGLNLHPNSAATQTFTLTVTTAEGCVTTDTLTVPIQTFSTPSFSLHLPSTGLSGTAGDTLNYSWSSNPGINSVHHRVELLRDSTVVADVTSGNGTTTLSGPTGTQSYSLRIVQRNTGRVLASSESRSIINHAPPGNPAITVAGTHGGVATVGDTVRFTLNTPSGFNTNLHTLQYRLPGASWTDTSPGASFTHTQTSTGTATISVRIISKNNARELHTASTTITYAAAPTINSVAWQRSTATRGDTLNLSATLSNYNSNLHQLQRAPSGSTSWSDVAASTSVTVNSTGSQTYTYRIINKLSGAPSNGRVYDSRNSNTLNVYAPPTMSTCSISPSSALGGTNITVNAPRSGYRSELHTLQWRRTAPTSTSWATFTATSFSTTLPSVAAGGTARYEVRVNNRFSGSFTSHTSACTSTILPQPQMRSVYLSGNIYRGQQATLSWDQATHYNSSLHRYEWRRTSPSTTSWTNVNNSRSVTVSLPTSGSTVRYQVRVVSRSNGQQLSVASTATYTLAALPTISAPNAGTVRSGQNYTASWSTSNYNNSVFKTQIRRHNGSSWSSWTDVGSNGNAKSYTYGGITNTGASRNYSIEARIVWRSGGGVVSSASGNVRVRPPAPPTPTLSQGSTGVCRTGSNSARETWVSWNSPPTGITATITATNASLISRNSTSRTVRGSTSGTAAINVTVTFRNADGETASRSTSITRQAPPSISYFRIDGTTNSTTQRLIRTNATYTWSASNHNGLRLDGSTVTGSSTVRSVGTSTGTRIATLTALGRNGCANATAQVTYRVTNQIWIRIAAWNHNTTALNDLPTSSTAHNLTASHTGTANISVPPTSGSTLRVTLTAPVLSYVSSRRSSTSINHWAGRWNNSGNWIATWHHTVGFSSGMGTHTLNSSWRGPYSMGTQYGGNSGSGGSLRGSHNRIELRYNNGTLSARFSNHPGHESFADRFSGLPTNKYVQLGYLLRITVH